MEKITTVGIDLAKSVFSLHGVDGAGIGARAFNAHKQAGYSDAVRSSIGTTVTVAETGKSL